jgi:phosphatidate cytidylyltransferase
MLRWRLLLGPLLIAAVAALCWLDLNATTPGMYLAPLALLLSLVASQELLWLFSSRNLRPAAWMVYSGNLLIVASNWGAAVWPAVGLATLGWPLMALGLTVLWTFLAEMARFTGPGQVSERLGLAVLSLTYVGLLLSFVCQLRLLGPGGTQGIAALASLVIVVKMGDIGAYTIGRIFGRHKMAPVLSPGKTLEGAAGAVVFAVMGAWLTFRLLLPRIASLQSGGLASETAATSAPAWGWIVFGVVVGLAGLFGDLAESLLKRDLGRKDSSNWLPGFGGVLDLLDSILFAAPVAYLCWTLGWVA